MVGQPVMLDFERLDLNRERLRELILTECQYFRDIRLVDAQAQSNGENNEA